MRIKEKQSIRRSLVEEAAPIMLIEAKRKINRLSKVKAGETLSQPVE